MRATEILELLGKPVDGLSCCGTTCDKVANKKYLERLEQTVQCLLSLSEQCALAPTKVEALEILERGRAAIFGKEINSGR